jgi:carbohydrate-selective porin OprB
MNVVQVDADLIGAKNVFFMLNVDVKFGKLELQETESGLHRAIWSCKFQERPFLGSTVGNNFPQCHHMFSRTSWSALWRWRSVTDFLVWDAHEARLRRPVAVSGDIWRLNARGVLSLPKPKPTNYPDHGHDGDPPPKGKFPW